MKRQFKIAAIIIISILLITPQVYAKEGKEKIGYVDLYKVFAGYYKTQEFEEALEKKRQKKVKEKEKMTRAIKKLQEEAELLSASDRGKKLAAIEEKIKNLGDFDRAAREELNRETDKAQRDLFIEIGKFLSLYGNENNYDLILDARTLFFGSKDLDISDEIIKEINKKR